MLFKINKNYKIDKDMLEKMFETHDAEKQRLKKLQELYKGGTCGALDRSIAAHKPNNKLYNHYAGYISNTLVGYMLGVPVNVMSNNDIVREEVEKFNNRSDINSHNINLALKASIAGYAYELCYTDEEAKEKVAILDTSEVIYAVDNTVEQKPLFALRYFSDITLDDGEYYIEVYEPDRITYYLYNGKELHKEGEQKINSFGEVPVSRLINDGDEMGDFERVVSLIEAYNISQSDTANDFEYFTDAILGLYGELEEEYDEETGEKKPHNFKDNKVVKLSEGSKIEWIVKDINDTATENYKNRLDRDIHKFSFCPDMSSETFGNTSGESLKWRVSGLRYRGGIKIQNFKKLLERRYRLLFNSLCFKKNATLIDDIENLLEFKFTENLPKNAIELINNIKNMDSIVSIKTKTELVEEITNVKSEDELKRLEEEREQDSLINEADFKSIIKDNSDEEAE